MDDLTITDIISTLADFFKAAYDYASGLDGRSGFILGALTWWTVEAATRHVATLIRWGVLLAVLGGGAAIVGSNLEIVQDLAIAQDIPGLTESTKELALRLSENKGELGEPNGTTPIEAVQDSDKGDE